MLVLFSLVSIIGNSVVFGQIPGIVVSEFTSRARDIHEEDLFTVKDMFMTALTDSKVNVISQTVLNKSINSLKFVTEDWSDNSKTTQLGENLNADYIVSGTITQLGNSITFTVIVRYIKTLAVIVTVPKQYTIENVWRN